MPDERDIPDGNEEASKPLEELQEFTGELQEEVESDVDAAEGASRVSELGDPDVAKTQIRGLGLLANIVDPAKILDQEWERQSSLERRGITVVTSSGAFVTLIFAVSALVTKLNNAKNLDPAEVAFIAASMAAFLVAGLFAVMANRPEDYGAIGRELIDQALRGMNEEEQRVLRRQTTLLIGHIRDVNGYKASLIKRAIQSQMLGLLLLVIGLMVIVIAAATG